jgi:hypothetical protein
MTRSLAAVSFAALLVLFTATDASARGGGGGGVAAGTSGGGVSDTPGQGGTNPGGVRSYSYSCEPVQLRTCWRDDDGKRRCRTVTRCR